MTHRLHNKIQQAGQENRPALIPYLPAGFPEPDRFWQELLELDQNGADIIEIGIPFSDPVADGPVVEQASQKCLASGVHLEWILTGLEKIRADIQAEIVLMGYVNPFLQYGWQQAAKRAAKSRVAGLIIPDLPLEESRPVELLLAKHHLQLVPLIGLNTPKTRMQLYARRCRSFVYFVSVLGTTGARQELPLDLQNALAQARSIFSQPLVLGFGLHHPDQIAPVREWVDGLVFGSALIEHLGSGGTSRDFLSRWHS